MRRRNRQGNIGWKLKAPLAAWAPALLCLSALVYWGCNGPGTNPTAPPVVPLRGFTLNFTVPLTNEVRASLLNVSSNDVLYNVTGPGMQPVVGMAGPFNTNSSVGAGELDFPIPVPQGSARLIAFELTNAANGQPLALGAVQADINAGGVSDIWVTMGSVIRNCYTVDSSPLTGVGFFNFMADSLSPSAPASWDMAVTTTAGGFNFAAGPTGQIAYMGNGPLVNFDSVPAAPAFYNSSVLSKTAAGTSPAFLQAGDVYCVSLGTGGANGHAWVQVVNPNQPFGLYPPGPMGPKFIFRVNRNLPYFAYDETTADAGGNCLTPAPSPTNVPTNTFTPTPSPTVTNTPTVTSTPTNTFSPTITFTPSDTNTPFVPTSTFTDTITDTPTHTASPTITNTPFIATFTSISSPTSSATLSPTSTITSTPTGTSTNIPTGTFTGSPTNTPTSAITSTVTNSPTPTFTGTPTSSATDSPTLTPTNTPSGTITPVLTSTPTSTPTLSPTLTPTSTQTLTATNTVTSSPTSSPSPLPTPQLASAAVSCINAGTGGSCRVFQLSINASGPSGFSSESYAYVKDLSNSTSVLVGPWTYSGAGTTFTTNLSGESFGVTSTSSPVSAALSVVLVDQTQSVTFGTLTPANSPISLEAPPGYIYSTGTSCQTTLEDGNCSVLNFSIYAYTPACAATQVSMVRLTDTTNGASTLIGPVTYTCNNFNFIVPSENLGLTAGQQALNQQFTATLYDSTGTQVWDSKAAGTQSLEYPGNAIASSSLSCVTADTGNGSCQAFSLTINANGPPGVPSTSYAYVTDNTNGNTVWVGPWTYTGTDSSYSVTLLAEDFGLTTPNSPVSTNFSVKLYDASQTKILDTSIPTGSPMTIEAPSEYIYNNSFTCNTAALDGNCEDFTFSTDLYNRASNSVTSLVQLIDLTQGTTVFLGPFVNAGPANDQFTVPLTAAAFGLSPNQTAANHAFQEVLTDSTGVTALDNQPAGTFSYEYPGNYLTGSAITCLYSDSGNGACQGFQLTIDPNGPPGIPAIGYAHVTDLQNNSTVWVGPITYTGTGSAYAVTLLGDDFGLSTGSSATLTGFKVDLYDETQSRLLDTDTPANSPLTLEYPKEYIYSSSWSCTTPAEDGNCTYFTFTANLDNPGSSPMTTLVKLTDTTSGNSVFLGPFVNNGGGNTGYSTLLNGAEFSLTPGQTAVTHLFQAQLYDAGGVTIMDTESAGTLSYEYPSAYIASSSIAPYLTDSGNSAVQAFTLTVNPVGPPGVTSTSYALVTDLQNSGTTWVGPITYTGSSSSYSVTLKGSDFSLTTSAAPVSTAFTVKLYNSAQNTLLDTSIPVGSPVTLEAPTEFIYGTAQNNFTCITTLEDGNCGYFTYNTDLDAPFGASKPVTSVVKLIDQSALPAPVTLTLGPFINNSGSNTAHAVTLSAASFGLTPGQTALNQSFYELLYDASGVTLLDQLPAMSANFEYPSPYLSGASITPILTDAAHGGAVQTFLLAVTATGPAGASSSNYAEIIDNQNSNSVSVGPWTYTGAGSLSVTLKGSDFSLTTNAAPVSTSFTVRLFSPQGQWLDTLNPAGSPVSFEAPTAYIYGSAQNNFTCVTTAEDGNCIYMTYNTDLVAPFSAATPVTTLVKLENLSSGITLTLGPFVNNSGSNTAHAVTLSAASFGLGPGQAAVNQAFQEQLYDATGVTLLDQTPAQPASYEYPTNYFSSAAITVLSTDSGNGAVQRFQLTVRANGPSGVPSTNYVYVTDLQNSGTTWVGPYTYTGTGSSFAVTLKGSDFGLTTGAPVSTAFQLKLFDAAQTHWFDTLTPAGLPMTLEAPMAYIFGSAQNAFNCTTSAEDGNCVNFTYNTDLVAPYAATTPVTTLVKLENLTSGVTLTLGPFVNNTGSNTAHAVTLTPGSFGLAPGQTALNQVFFEQLFDATGVTILDQTPAQTFSYEYPTNYFASTSIMPLQQDGGTGAYQAFDLTLNPNGPPGIPSISYAYVMDNNNSVNNWVGPITYTGTASSYSVTLYPEDFNLTTASLPVSTAFTVRLYDETQAHWLDTSTPSGSPVTLEAPNGYIYNNSFTGNVLAEDGNSVTWTFNTTLNTPGSTTLNFLYALVDLSTTPNPATVFFGPVANATGNHVYAVTVTGATAQFGLASGQQAVSQQFEELLYDSSGVTLLDYYLPPLTLSIENNTPTSTVTYNNSSVSPLIQDTSGNWQSFIFNVNLGGGAGVTSTAYARLTDLNNASSTLVGPFTFSGGSSNNFPVTVKASDFGIVSSTAVSTAMAVTLYAGNQSTVLANGTPAGSPATLIAPLQNFTSGSLSCNTVAEDGNCETFSFNSGMRSPSGPTVVTDLRLVDTSTVGGPVTVDFGPVTDNSGGGNSASTILYAQQFGLTTSGQTALNQAFTELLYDQSGVTLLDTRSVGAINLETSSPYLASSSVGCAQAGALGCQQYTLTLNPQGPAGVPKTSYAKVVDLNNGANFFVGPFTFNGFGPSYSVTMNGWPLGITANNAVSNVSFAVTLYDAAKSTAYNYSIPSGSPISIQSPIQYLSSGSLSCNTTAEDGNCETFTFSTGMNSPSGPTVTTYLQLVDTNASPSPVTVNLGPVTDSGGGGNSASYTLYAQQFGLTTAGAAAANQVFQEYLYADAAATTLLDTRNVGTLGLEAPSPILANASIGCAQADPGNGACQQFVLNLNAQGPAGVPKTSYAKVVDLNNGTNLFVGPWTYSGAGTTYSVTLTGQPFNIFTAGAVSNVSFAVTLYDATKTQQYNYLLPTGSPVSLEAPVQYIYSNAFSCGTSAVDGNCSAFTFSTNLQSPSGPTVTTYPRLIDQTTGVTVNLGPVTDTGGGGVVPSFNLLPAQFGVTTAGEIAPNQVFFEQLFADAAGTTLLDQKPVGTFNLEAPSPYLASTSLSCLVTDPATLACRSVQLNINPNGPPGVPKTVYAYVTDLVNNVHLWEGPFTFTGSGSSFAVTIRGTDLSLGTANLPVSTAMSVTLYDESKVRVLDSDVPAGSPLTMEAPLEYLNANNPFSCTNPGEDGNCQAFNFSPYVIAPGSATVTTMVKLIDLSNSTTVTINPIVDVNGGTYNPSYPLLPSQFGVTAAGQVAANQAFMMQLYDSTGVTLLDTYFPGSLNLETPSPYLAGVTLAPLVTDPGNLATQGFVLSINANAPTGTTKSSSAWVLDKTTGTGLWVGPWTYTGPGTNFPVTLLSSSFGVTANAPLIAHNFAVTLFNAAENQPQGALAPTGSPVTLEAPFRYISNQYFTCNTTGVDGNCQYLNFYTALDAPFSGAVTSLVKLIDLSNSTTVVLGPIAETGPTNVGYSFNLAPQQFAVTAAGQTALNQVFLEQLYDASGVTLYDTKNPGSLNMENSSPFLSSSTVSFLTTDAGNGAGQAFQLTLNASGPAGVPETSNAYVADLTSGTGFFVGPWSYTGSGSFAVTLSAKQFGLATAGLPVASQLAVTLYNGTQSQVLGVSFPNGGAPLTLETAPAYINSTSANVQTAAEDGNWNSFNFYLSPYTPACATTQTGLIRVLDVTSGAAVTIGPVTFTCNNLSWVLTAAQFGLAPGQSALNQNLVAQLYDATGTYIWDSRPVGTVNLEYPPLYLSSSSVSCLTTDGGNGACQAFQLTLNANAPAGVSQAAYAYVSDLANGHNLWVGPWGFTGSGTSYSVTLSGFDLGMTVPNSPVPAQLAVTLYGLNQTSVYSSAIPAGAPITLEEPLGTINGASLSCPASLTAEDGNCKAFNFSITPGTPSCATTQTSLVRVVDVTSGAAVTLGPITYTCSAASVFSFTANQFGLSSGQQALNQTFRAELYNASGTSVWHTYPLGTFNLEGQ